MMDARDFEDWIISQDALIAKIQKNQQKLEEDYGIQPVSSRKSKGYEATLYEIYQSKIDNLPTEEEIMNFNFERQRG